MRSTVQVADEDLLRAQLYRLLTTFLSASPSKETLAQGAQLTGDATPLGQAIGTFAHLCDRSATETVSQEYYDLFIGMGRGELLPFGSYYLTGFLNEKPLAQLRTDMDKHGIARDPKASEPEDHIASVCEIMAGLVDGRFGDPLPLDAQQVFYEKHIKSWAPYFFRDLESAKSSVLYAGLGAVGRVFLEIEDTAFSMVPAG